MPPVLQASLTDPIVNFAVDVVDAMGLAGVFLLMLSESACIPIPSEATMLFAGFNVSDGEYSLFAAVTVGVAANVVGSWIAYAVGYYGRIDILEKHGKKLHIKPSHLAWADRWFERYGDATVFFSRMLPIIRTFISLPAGVAKMPFWRFTLLTTLGCIPWVFMLTFIGKQAGDNWEKWKDNLHYVDYAVAASDRARRDLAVRAPASAPPAASPPPMRRAEAVALGLLQGPAELLPISSSAHVGLLLDRLGRVAGAERKELEVALHAGTALALRLERRGSRWGAPDRRRPRRPRWRAWRSSGVDRAAARDAALDRRRAGAGAVAMVARRPRAAAAPRETPAASTGCGWASRRRWR